MKQGKKFTRLFFATDLHGSGSCFKKFVGAAEFYKPDVLVLGGDITGKYVVPMMELGDGTLKAYYLGKEEILRTSEEIKHFEQTVIDSGFYNYRCGESEMVELKGSK